MILASGPMRLTMLLIALMGTAGAQKTDSSRYFAGGSLGVVFHRQQSSSVNGFVQGKNSAGLFAEAFIERKMGSSGRHRLRAGINLGNFLFRNEVIAPLHNGETTNLGGATTGSGSGYFKLHIHYGIAVAVWRDFQATFEAGPTLLRQNNIGYWSGGTSSVADTSAAVPYILEVRDSISMTRRFNAGVQGGVSLRFRFSARGWISLGAFYHQGFLSMNRQDIRAFFNGKTIDQGVSTSSGSGLFMKIGVGFAIRPRPVASPVHPPG